ncbi:MAG: 2Fe-2S iron-sulfur cluster-binding protein [Alphaproteobacteria bacterium]|nr:2Fe-2S iron-sulfur cluster-binding protein [Alphaproteobacteria bacterium]
MAVAFTLNGAAITVPAEPGDLLIDTLRTGCGLTGTRYGCGEEQCGACLVLIDGAPAHACGRETATLEGRAVTTAEAIPAAIRDAFLAEQAGQCGYCLSGMLVAATALLARNPSPDRAAIVEALDGNLCRCGSHPRIIAAILRAGRAA